MFPERWTIDQLTLQSPEPSEVSSSSDNTSLSTAHSTRLSNSVLSSRSSDESSQAARRLCRDANTCQINCSAKAKGQSLALLLRGFNWKRRVEEM